MRAAASERALAVALATVAAVALFVSNAAAAPSPFRHDLRRIDARLRTGIEYAPVELVEGFSTSENVCRLAEKAEQRGDSGGATADWSTLSQLVAELDRPALARVDGALQRADTGLLALRAKYAAGWTDQEKVAELGRGVTRTRAGIQRLRGALEKMAESFDAWAAHQCQPATEAVELGIARVPAAVARVNAGMRILWGLALPDADLP